MTATAISESLRVGLRPGLTFDAESASLLGFFQDELAAYRARKQWREILHGFFLLDEERDYTMTIVQGDDGFSFITSCVFTSACGRYAFWRLINSQAPDAESRLAAGSPVYRPKARTNSKNPADTSKSSWIFTAAADLEKLEGDRRRGTLFQGLMRLFQ